MPGQWRQVIIQMRISLVPPSNLVMNFQCFPDWREWEKQVLGLSPPCYSWGWGLQQWSWVSSDPVPVSQSPPLPVASWRCQGKALGLLRWQTEARLTSLTTLPTVALQKTPSVPSWQMKHKMHRKRCGRALGEQRGGCGKTSPVSPQRVPGSGPAAGWKTSRAGARRVGSAGSPGTFCTFCSPRHTGQPRVVLPGIQPGWYFGVLTPAKPLFLPFCSPPRAPLCL